MKAEVEKVWLIDNSKLNVTAMVTGNGGKKGKMQTKEIVLKILI